MSLSLADPHIPIVGQAITLTSYLLAPLFECQCARPSAVQMIVLAADGRINSAPAQCHSCGTVWQLQGYDMVDGAMRFNVLPIRSAPSDAS